MGIDVPTKKFGEALRAQVEERLAFFEVSSAPDFYEARSS